MLFGLNKYTHVLKFILFVFWGKIPHILYLLIYEVADMTFYYSFDRCSMSTYFIYWKKSNK